MQFFYIIPNIVGITESVDELSLFPFCKNKRPPYWNYSGFDVDHITVIRTLPVFCVKLANFIYIGPSNAETWRHIYFSGWRPRRFNNIPGFVLVNATVFGRSKSISKQISSTYLNSWLIYNYFRFGIRNVRIYEFYFRFRFRSYHAIRMLFCIMLLNFIQIGPAAAEIWRHIHFSRWRQRPLNGTFGFAFEDKIYQQTNYRRYISIDNWNITTSVFEKLTFAIL